MRRERRYTIWFGLTGQFFDITIQTDRRVRVYNVDTHATYYVARAECASWFVQARTYRHTSLVRV